MTWAQRLKRVVHIDIDTCRESGGAVKVIACIEEGGASKKGVYSSHTQSAYLSDE
jgi:hypothetical protein